MKRNSTPTRERIAAFFRPCAKMLREKCDPRGVFTVDRILCRLIAAFLAVCAVGLMSSPYSYTNLSYRQGISPVTGVLLPVLLLFAAATVPALFIKKTDTDALFLFAAGTVAVGFWTYDGASGKNGIFTALAALLTETLLTVWFLGKLEPPAVPDGTIPEELPGEEKRPWKTLPWREKAVLPTALAGALVSCAILSAITVLRYRTFSSPNFDFGLFCNMFYRMKTTGLPLVTCERDRLLSHFAVHISPAFYLLLPLYFLFPSPATLQVGQALFLLAGVIPLLLIAKHYRLSPGQRTLAALLYCFFPALSTGCFYDLHENCFLPFFLLFTFYFFEKKKPIPMTVFALLVLSVKEDAAIYLLIFAAYAILSRRRYRDGALLGVLSVAAFALTSSLLAKYGLGMMSYRYENLVFDPDTGLAGVILTALKNPGFFLTQVFTESDGGWEKLLYLAELLLPLGLLPMMTKKASRWLLCLPVLINLITLYPYQYQIGFQYSFGITAFLVYAAILNLADQPKHAKRTLPAIAAAACFCLYLALVLPSFSHYTALWRENKTTYRETEALLDTVPREASVNCSTFLLAHLADRDEIYEIEYHENRYDTDYAVIDMRYSDGASLRRSFLANGYAEESSSDEVCILKKN